MTIMARKKIPIVTSDPSARGSISEKVGDDSMERIQLEKDSDAYLRASKFLNSRRSFEIIDLCSP